jgi:anti-sigma regulatory factor (Ser/Thr protein kinase)
MGVALRTASGSPRAREPRRLRLRLGRQGVAEARAALAGIEREIDAGLFFDISLCVSELVTNAVRAVEPDVASPMELEVSLVGDTLRASVHDAGGGARRLQTVLLTGEDHDFGLYIISRLAHRWGIDHVGNVIWLEFEVGAQSQPRTSAFTAQDLDREG